ncbi:MAG: DUF5658 family protein [Dehalococcoidia bacterium]|nr:hypothetical protein [Chloroflexota bacterium]MBT9162635.1 hypothetical protein [Chloroflexota bacterium]
MQNWWLAIKLALIFLLNLADLFLSWYMLQTGLVTEVNPVMDFLLGLGPGYALVLKLLAGALFVSYMWNLRKSRPRMVQVLTTVVLTLFVFLVAYLYLMLTYVRIVERLLPRGF